MKAFFTLFILALSFSACTSSEEKTDSSGTPAALVDGTQVIEIAAEPAGFTPARIELKAGVPARLVFTRTDASSCAETVSVPEFGVEKKPLPVGEQVAVEFTPAEDGEFTFVCGMDMAKGALVVSS